MVFLLVQEYSSRLDHGGTWFQARTAEVGYAKTRYAYFNCVPKSIEVQRVCMKEREFYVAFLEKLEKLQAKI